jgi:hypothetical protein
MSPKGDNQTKNNQLRECPTAISMQQDTEIKADLSPAIDEISDLAFANLLEFDEPEGRSYSDLTGRFPCKSDRGNQYVLVLYVYDDNAILVEPVKNRSESEQVKAYKSLLERANKGSQLKMHWMDNEASKAVKDVLVNTYKLTYQLVPPHIHRRNAAERAIRTFKNHFIAGLSSVDKAFPLRLWDRLIPQAEATLNMMRTSRTNPKISAYEAIGGKFDFNKTPLAPPGCKVIIHEKPGQRASWDQHGVPGWYLEPANEHYRCYRCYVPKTQAERISDTVEFFPAESKTPKKTPNEAAITAAEALQEALNSKNTAVQMPELVETSRAALQKLSEIFTTPASRCDQGEGPLARVTTSPKPQPVPQSATGSLPRVASSIPQPIASRTRAATEPTDIVEAATIQNNALQFYANAVLHPMSGKPMTYRELLRDPLTRSEWELSSANEFGRLAQGVGGRIKGTDIRFIRHSEMPTDRKATYPRFVCEHRPQKTEVNRTRLTLGGNLINYPGNVSTRTAELETIKILFNSVISTKGAEFISIDIKNFYLNTPLERPEYV